MNLASKGAVAVVDTQKRSVLKTFPLEGAAKNFPMAFDGPSQRLFLGCRKPAQVLVVDAQSGKTLARSPAVGDADDVFFDAAHELLFVIGGEGFVDVFWARAGAKLVRQQRIPTAPGARTGLWSQDSARLFVAVPGTKERGAQIRVFALTP